MGRRENTPPEQYSFRLRRERASGERRKSLRHGTQGETRNEYGAGPLNLVELIRENNAGI